jgi:2TM domain
MNDPFERAVLRDKLERRERQTRHVAAGFRTHVMIFVIVNVGLVVFWLVENALDDGSSWNDPWFVYSLVAWGLALAFHGWNVLAHLRRDAALRARLEESGATS